MGQIVTRTQAIEIGQKWYFTGEPCRKGHIAKRSVSNYECRKCVDERHKRRRAENPEIYRSREKKRYWKGREKRLAQSKANRIKHVEKRRAYDRARYHGNPTRKQWNKDQAGRWAKLNKGKRNFIIQKRRKHIKLATPCWLTKQHWAEIKAIYERAANMDGKFHVDHIIPLRGRNICGLHVPWNLQILPALENIRKSNDF